MARATRPYRMAGLALAGALVVFATTLGTALAMGHHPNAKAAEGECTLGGPECINIGITDGWFQGSTVEFQYSHDFFCAEPPPSSASSSCEAGSAPRVDPPSGDVGAPVWVLIPKGFTPDQSTLHCPVAGMCIDHPDTIDLSRVGGQSNATFPAHSVLIDDNEELNSVWWPVKVVFVTSQDGWNTLVAGQSLSTLRAVQHAGEASRDIDTNLFLWFEVYTPES
ncbi:MAG: hypothetical protein M3Q23_11620 [Actinomycetota bacterium]|nr:hypothetical protein [Actinomycetota bacterium]